MLQNKTASSKIHDIDIRSLLVKVANFLNIIFVFNLTYFWILQYFSVEPVDYIKRLSFIVEDIPWMPPGFIAKPYFGLHYFGDWQLAIAFARSDNPYLLEFLPSQTPPFGTFLIKVFALPFSSPLLELILFMLINIAFLILIFIYMVKRSDKTKFEIIYLIASFLLHSSGFFLNIDRGSLHFWTYFLLVFTIISFTKNWKLALIFFIICVSLKPQMLITLVFFIKHINFKIFLKWFSILFVILNISTLFFYSGSSLFIKSVLGLSQGLVRYTSNLDGQMFDMLLRSISLQGSIATWIDLTYGKEIANLFFQEFNTEILLFMFLLFFIVLKLLLSNRVSLLCRLILIFSIPSYFVSISPPYNLIWIPAVVLLIFMIDFQDFGSFFYTRLDLLFMVFIIFIGIPINSITFKIRSESFRDLPAEFLIPSIVTLYILVNFLLITFRKYPTFAEK
jgi:hypothetical protein